MDNRKIHEMIDACRPGSEDVDLSEVSPLADQITADSALRRRYQRTQRLDARLARAVDDVDIPVGLRERILARLAEQGPGARGQEPGDGGEGRGARDEARGEAITVGRAPSRRRFFALAAVAAGLLLLVTGYTLWPRHATLTKASLLNLTGRWFGQLRANAAWQPLPPHEMIRDFPLADAIRPSPWRWADVTSVVGKAACAYDLSAPGGPRAVLFVIADEGQFADSTLPLKKPDSSTGGLMIGCWRSLPY